MDEEGLAAQSREMLADAQSLSEVDEALAVSLIRLDDLPVEAAIENPDLNIAPPRQPMRIG